MSHDGLYECTPESHTYIENYYGYVCTKCGLFVPFGCEFWIDYNDAETFSKDEFIGDEGDEECPNPANPTF